MKSEHHDGGGQFQFEEQTDDGITIRGSIKNRKKNTPKFRLRRWIGVSGARVCGVIERLAKPTQLRFPLILNLEIEKFSGNGDGNLFRICGRRINLNANACVDPSTYGDQKGGCFGRAYWRRDESNQSNNGDRISTMKDKFSNLEEMVKKYEIYHLALKANGGEWMMDPIKIRWFRRPGPSWSLVYLVRGGSRPNLIEGSLSAAMGFDTVGELTGSGHDRNLVVPFGGEPPGSEGPGWSPRRRRRSSSTSHRFACTKIEIFADRRLQPIWVSILAVSVASDASTLFVSQMEVVSAILVFGRHASGDFLRDFEPSCLRNSPCTVGTALTPVSGSTADFERRVGKLKVGAYIPTTRVGGTARKVRAYRFLRDLGLGDVNHTSKALSSQEFYLTELSRCSPRSTRLAKGEKVLVQAPSTVQAPIQAPRLLSKLQVALQAAPIWLKTAVWKLSKASKLLSSLFECSRNLPTLSKTPQSCCLCHLHLAKVAVCAGWKRKELEFAVKMSPNAFLNCLEY
ncbi:hypothetical protein M5K25_010997 [Dendrobium thyrsiflorum]|uniref:Uncharacterized protein n=1 Tax=Dendrobium thyrsiflorum TaxID=117978 RepID=A0ABD0V1K4_DENTH